MTKLRISQAAEADLIEIRLYSNREFGAAATDGYMRGFTQVFRRMRQFPQIGPMAEDFDDGTRALAYRSHRIFYEIDESGIFVLRILHSAQNPMRHVKQ